MTRSHARAAGMAVALLVAGLVWLPGATAGTEIGAMHLVFEKPAKMKRIEVSLTQPFLDQARKGDRQNDPRTLHCAVTPRGRKGLLSVRGQLRLRLLGERRGAGAPWQSSALGAALDDRGEALFSSEAILELVSEAAGEQADIQLFRVDFVGGKGGRVAELTIDCLLERGGE